MSETNGRGARAGSYKQHQRRQQLSGGCRSHGNGIRPTCGCEEGPPASSCDGVERDERRGGGFTPPSARTEHKGTHLETSNADFQMNETMDFYLCEESTVGSGYGGSPRGYEQLSLGKNLKHGKNDTQHQIPRINSENTVSGLPPGEFQSTVPLKSEHGWIRV